MGLAVDFKTITEMFDNVTMRFGHEQRPLLMHKVDDVYRRVTFGEVRMMVEQCALGLSALGVRHGDMIGLISENRPEWVVADIGMIALGAINVSLYPTMTPKQIEFIFNDAGVKIAIVSNQMHLNKVLKIFDNVKSLNKVIVMNGKGMTGNDRVRSFVSMLETGKILQSQHPNFLREAAKKNQPEDLLTLIYTSGTTGNPKGVMLTHHNMVSNIYSAATCLPISHQDLLLSFLPLSHSFERMGGYYTAMGCGATIAHAESIDTIGENLLEVRPTVVTSVPRLFERMYNRILKQVEAQSPIEQKIFHWAIGVGDKYAEAKRSRIVSPLLVFKRQLADKLVCRKLRERTGGRVRFFVSGGAALARELGEFFEAIGLHIIEGYGLSESSPVISVNTMDNYKFGSVGKPIPGVEVKIAEDGEVLARGPNIMKGYWNDPEATRKAIDEDHWLHTGDIGMFDEDGFLHITDRKKHLFVSSGGNNIAPQPIENTFLQSKYIDQFVLIGDGKMYLTALVVPDFDLIQEYARQHHIEFKSIEELVKREEIYKLLEREIGQRQQDVAAYERVRKFTVLSSPLSIDNGELTPTLKVKRKVVEEKYQQCIESMYANVS